MIQEKRELSSLLLGKRSEQSAQGHTAYIRNDSKVGAEHMAESNGSGELVFSSYLSTTQSPLRFKIPPFLCITRPKFVQFCL